MASCAREPADTDTPPEAAGHPRIVRPRRAQHYRSPRVALLRPEEFGRTTILLGGLSRLHDRFLAAVLEGAGHRSEALPVPDLECFHIGREFCNAGLCSPAYFTIGNLIRRLRRLESSGLTRAEIIDRHVFFTAGSCGPCRFGMYLPEYQLALRNSGFEGFRVLAFRQTVSGVSGSASGLPMSTEFGLGVFKAFMLADLLNDYACQVRPYEVRIGETNRVVEECASEIAGHLRGFHAPEYREVAAPVLRRWLEHRKWLRGVANAAYKIKRHLHGVEFAALTSLCRERLGQVEMDRTRVRPIVKIVGEFWAATTEGDGNYRMFEFLEREGAQVRPESMGSWVMYLLHHARGRVVDRHDAEVTSGFARVRPAARFLLTLCAYDFGRWFYTRSYGRVARALGGFGHHLVSHARLSELASEFYHPLARGGEGYQEVGKTIHYGCGGQAHLIASLKPFGCLPSMQSDGVQVSVLDRFPELMFVAIETSGDGEAQAESRMQMALADARERARVEFEAALTLNRVSLSEVRAYAAMHPHLRRPTWSPPENGGGSVAARFVSHVAELIRRDPVWRGRREAPRESARAGARDSDPVAS